MKRGVSVRRRVCGGEPCILGTRVPTRTVMALFMTGESVEALRTYFVRRLTTEQVEAAIRYELGQRRVRR